MKMNQNFEESLNTIANAVELATCVVSRIAGDLVSSSINGQMVNSAMLSQTCAAKIQAGLKSEVGVLQ
jgi:hypothetical protein